MVDNGRCTGLSYEERIVPSPITTLRRQQYGMESSGLLNPVNPMRPNICLPLSQTLYLLPVLQTRARVLQCTTFYHEYPLHGTRAAG